MNLTILSIFGIVPISGQEKIVNICLKIFNIGFLVLWLVCQIRLFWHIIIVINKRWTFIRKVFLLNHFIIRLVQLIIKLQIKIKINKGVMKGFFWLYVASIYFFTISALYIWLAQPKAANAKLALEAKRSLICLALIQNVQYCTWYFSTTNHYYLI